MTYALQVTMYHIARVKVVEAVRHVPQLPNLMLKRSGGGEDRNEFAHQAGAIYIRIFSYILSNCAIFHPTTNNLERWYLRGNSKERDDVGML